MTDETRTDLTDEELEAQQAEPLPDREAMSIVTPGFERPVPIDQIDIAPPPLSE
jgi:hypothetical protein